MDTTKLAALDALEEDLALIRKKIVWAFECAEHSESRTVERVGGRSSDVSSSVEVAVLKGLGNTEVAGLERSLEAAVLSVANLAGHVRRLASPRARNTASGKVVVECGNSYGCPTGGVASRQGFCGACWHFLDAQGRHRRRSDVEELAERKRVAARERARARSGSRN